MNKFLIIENEEKPRIEKLAHVIQVGDWHDKLARWNVIWRNKNQIFSTKKNAIQYARIWRKNGFAGELESIHDYQTL